MRENRCANILLIKVTSHSPQKLFIILFVSLTVWSIIQFVYIQIDNAQTDLVCSKCVGRRIVNSIMMKVNIKFMVTTVQTSRPLAYTRRPIFVSAGVHSIAFRRSMNLLWNFLLCAHIQSGKNLSNSQHYSKNTMRHCCNRTSPTFCNIRRRYVSLETVTLRKYASIISSPHTLANTAIT
jgi:hypothetical protein